MGQDYIKDIYNYIKFMITQVSYEIRNSKRIYVLKGVKNLKQLMEQNKIFYINENNNIYGSTVPLSNYSTNKIFNLFNGGKDSKYLWLHYKIKDEDFINYEKENKKYLDKLINVSDVKNMV